MPAAKGNTHDRQKGSFNVLQIQNVCASTELSWQNHREFDCSNPTEEPSTAGWILIVLRWETKAFSGTSVVTGIQGHELKVSPSPCY